MGYVISRDLLRYVLMIIRLRSDMAKQQASTILPKGARCQVSQ